MGRASPFRSANATSKIAMVFGALALGGCIGSNTWEQRETFEETCNGIDDDADGTIDLDSEGALLTQDCSNACGPGVMECINGSWEYCTAPQPQEETCNDVDDDCDGFVDEDCDCIHGETRRCSTGELGECADGMQLCDAGMWSECVSDSDPGQPEICDGLDNDCDGEIDEELECPCDVVKEGERTYLFCVEDDTWEGALEQCHRMSATLASIETAEEDDFITQEALARVFGYWWIGLNDLEEEGVFRWAGSDELATYTNWYSTEPNNANEGEHCVATCYAGGWNDDNCSSRLPFVCERL